MGGIELGRLAPGAVAATLLLAGCGGGDRPRSPAPPPERADRAARPPAGWATVANRRAGFTIAAPPRWTRRTREAATLVRSPDRLVAVTVSADRTRAGRRVAASAYARRTLAALPGFRGIRPVARGRVSGSPYESARASGAGLYLRTGRRQRIAVAVFRRPARVTYAAVAFRDAAVPRRRHARTLERMLASFRARPPGR